MQRVRFCLGLAAPLALLGAATAVAQQPVQPHEVDPSGSDEAAQTRELEREIEQYPRPDDAVRDESADTRIPEQIHPAPRKPRTTPRPHAASPPTPTRAPAGASSSSAIDPSEVQRVFGSDAAVIPLDSLGARRITRLQVRLRELGYYRGPIDGVVGPQTRAALQSYARAQFALKQRLLKQDQLTTDLAEQLGVDPRATLDGTPAPGDDSAPALPGEAPLLPPGGAPLPPPGMTPLPTPSSSPSSMPPERSGATPAVPPPSP